MKNYYHSVRLKEGNCIGCVHCLKFCPTQAIRIKSGKAEILKERCIDCGGCIEICPNRAKIVASDPLETMENYSYKVALVPPALLVQFDKDTAPEEVLKAFFDIGFDSVFSLSLGAEWYADKVNNLIASGSFNRPLLSTHCPAVVRLIQVKFPELVKNLVPFDTPLDITAELARDYLSNNMEWPEKDTGLFLITMCSARVTAVKSPEGREESSIDGVISIENIYAPLYQSIKKAPSHDEETGEKNQIQEDQSKLFPPKLGVGIGFDVTGFAKTGLDSDNSLSISGINNIIEVLEEVELGKLSELDYIELHSCYGGCVGGILNVENPFVTRVRMNKTISDLENDSSYLEQIKEKLSPDFQVQDVVVSPRPMDGLAASFSQSVKRLTEVERLLHQLPQLDCGACGSPSCRALAEDVVFDRADMKDCVFYLLDNVANLTQEAYSLAKGIPHVLKMRHKGFYKMRDRERDKEE